MFRFAFAFLIAFALPLAAQQGILGNVTDASGAAVPAANIRILNTDTNAASLTATNSEGFFTAPSLPVGSYSVTAEKTGFKKAVRSGITLQVDQRAQVDFRLDVGETTEAIEVTGEAPLVDTSSATVGKVVENRRIADLPLNGRNALALVMLTPGVKSQAGPTNSGFVDRGTALSAISINGGPSSLNAFIVDGGNNNTAFLADINANPTVDAVQEFKVQSNVMSSEFGFTAGGVVNIVTKSGTNTPHGSLYYFVRNDAFDARNAFAATKAPFRYNQYGGTIGGPVILPKVYNGRNKTFVFFNYEGWQNRRYQSNILSVPTAAMRAGDFSDLRDATGKQIQIYDPNTTVANPAGLRLRAHSLREQRDPHQSTGPSVAQDAPVLSPAQPHAVECLHQRQQLDRTGERSAAHESVHREGRPPHLRKEHDFRALHVLQAFQRQRICRRPTGSQRAGAPGQLPQLQHHHQRHA